MFNHFQKCLRLYPLAGILSLFTAIPATAANLTLDGLFNRDDQVQLFDITVDTPALVDIQTFGYAGGTTSTGESWLPGGFDPILTLFDGAGFFLADNDEGAGVGTDPSTGTQFDARLTLNLLAGNYILALTQYDNFSLGDLADGFVYAGNPNFTADPTFTSGPPCAGGQFRDISGTTGGCRDGRWVVDFVNVAGVEARPPSSVVPEPATVLLFGSALAVLGIARRKLWKSHCSNPD